MLRILVYGDHIVAFLNHEDGCVMRQRVDVLTVKLTQSSPSTRVNVVQVGTKSFRHPHTLKV